jgi:hypothetical protein
MHTGMSVKKAHEIEQLASLIESVAKDNNGTTANHVVDVGAGQGYLARTLASSPYSMQVLALDSDGHQTNGAERRNTKKRQKIKEDEDAELSTEKGSLTHATVFVDSVTLPQTIDDWIPFQPGIPCVPIVITGLHACGSLTPAVIRAVIAMMDPSKQKRGWHCHGLAIVGCCYNRATREDGMHTTQNHPNKI